MNPEGVPGGVQGRRPWGQAKGAAPLGNWPQSAWGFVTHLLTTGAM